MVEKEEAKMRKKKNWVASLTVFVVLLAFMGISSADSTTKLMNLLIKKGIVTKEEAKELEQEIQAEEKQQEASTAAKIKEEAAKTTKVPEWTKKIEVGYKDGAYIRTTDKRFTMKFNFLLEPLFLYDDSETGADSTTFKIRRARLYISGNAFYPWLEYYTQMTLEGSSVNIRDAYVQATYFNCFQPRLGEFKVPYDREFLISSYGLEFIERSIASTEFSLQRDVGGQFAGNLLCNHLTYAVGVFNGGGINQANIDRDYMYTARIVWMPFDKVGYTQAAVENPEKPQLAIGIATGYLPGLEPGERKVQAGKLGDTSLVPVESDVIQAEGDITFAYRQFYMEGGYHFRNIDPKQDDLEKAPFGSQDAYGIYVQAGYFLIPKHFELAARWSYIDPDNPVRVSNNKQHEGTFGLNYFFFGHRLKAQANYTLLSSESDTGQKKDHIFQTGMVLFY
jgi:phosphate-selective porin OprO and OprP